MKHNIVENREYQELCNLVQCFVGGWRKMRLYWLFLSWTVRLWNAFFYRIKVKSPKFQENLIRTWALPLVACVAFVHLSQQVDNTFATHTWFTHHVCGSVEILLAASVLLLSHLNCQFSIPDWFFWPSVTKYHSNEKVLRKIDFHI